MCELVCVCVCVCVTQLSCKRITSLKCPFLWLETGSFSETGKRLLVIVYECLRGPSMVLLFSPVDSRWSECVAAAKKFCKKENKSVWRRRIYRKYASCRWLRTQDLNLRADVVLSMSRGPPGQWFPETEYWASSIFVETSGIPPKIIYRTVTSYSYFMLTSLENGVSGTKIWG